jgi:hypothetical protein
MRTLISQHARIRMQQRALPPAALDLLWEYGTSMRSRGADSLFFDKAARRRARAGLDADELRRVERYQNAFAVIADDGTAITIAWRTRRLRRH